MKKIGLLKAMLLCRQYEKMTERTGQNCSMLRKRASRTICAYRESEA